MQPAVQGSAADIYFPLASLQDLSGRQGRVNTVLVQANSSGNVSNVAAAISKKLGNEAQVVTTASLAAQVTGSLKDTKKLADRFGGVLAIIVLGSAFALAALLTLSSIGKRVREIGTLRAVGWPRRMVVKQILVETLGISAIGAVLGVGLGLVGGAVIGKVSPALTATVPTVNNSARLLAAVGARNAPAVTTATRTLHLTVPVDITTIAPASGQGIFCHSSTAPRRCAVHKNNVQSAFEIAVNTSAMRASCRIGKSRREIRDMDLVIGEW